MQALMLAAAMAGTLIVSERTEVRVREPGLLANQPSLDVEEDPDARLTLESRRETYLLEYAPQLASWDLNAVGVSPAYLNNGTASAQWRWRQSRLTLAESASYGRRNYASLVVPAAPEGTLPRVDVVPVGTTILYEASTSTLTHVATFSRWQLTTEVGYQLGGGADAPARTIIPFQSGPLGSVELDHTLTRRDHLLSIASGSEASFSSGPEDLLVEYDEAWRRLWTRTTSVELLGGVSEARTRTGFNAPYDHQTNPVAAVTLDQRIDTELDRAEVLASLRLGPVVNRLIGFVDERGQAQVVGKWTRRPVTLRTTASYAQSVDSSSAAAIRLFLGELVASYELSRAVLVDLGERVIWQEPVGNPANGTIPALLAVAFTQEVTFVGLTIRADPLRF